MKRILLLYYSQTGDVAQIAERFVAPLKALADVELHVARIEPVEPYPFPWRTLSRLLSVFPECHFGGGPGIKPLEFHPDERFDLVILAYQIWFLAPSIPIQDFLRSPFANVLTNTQVVTVCVSRNMWHSGSETMKRMLHDKHAIHLDNVVATHQGSAFGTFFSVPRLMLTGKRDRLLGIFPPAEVAQADLDRVGHLGAVVAGKFPALQPTDRDPLLKGQGAVKVKRLLILPELLGYYWYRLYGRFVIFAGRFGRLARGLAMALFFAMVLFMVFVGVPVVVLGSLLLYPLLYSWINRHAVWLAEPSG